MGPRNVRLSFLTLSASDIVSDMLKMKYKLY